MASGAKTLYDLDIILGKSKLSQFKTEHFPKPKAHVRSSPKNQNKSVSIQKAQIQAKRCLEDFAATAKVDLL